MSASGFSERRFVKVVKLDEHGLPTEEIVRLPRNRFRSLLSRALPLRLARLLGLSRLRAADQIIKMNEKLPASYEHLSARNAAGKVIV